jgi:DNA-binding CsgD family transcriptional regulator
MIELIKNPNIHIILWLGITFYSLASATVAMSLFIYCRKYSVLINSILLYFFFFIAFSQFLIINDKVMGTLKVGNEAETLSVFNVLLLIIFGFSVLIFETISLVKSAKGFREARNDIEASVKALIPLNSTWKPEQGLTRNIVKKFRITEAEQAVANLALLGKSNKEIAIILRKAVGTVETQLKSVYQKTEAPGRYALIALTAQSITDENLKT